MEKADGFEQTDYLLTLMLVALPAFLLIALPVHYRMLVRHGEKRYLPGRQPPDDHRRGMPGSGGSHEILMLEADVVIGGAAPAIVETLAGAVAVGLSFALPLLHRDE